MALCTQTDVEHILQIDIAAEPDPKITTLITLVQGEMEGPLGADRKLEADDYTEVLDPPYIPALRLANKPINSVTSVVEDGVTLTVTTDYLIYGEPGKILRVSPTGYPIWWKSWKPQSIEVDYNAGFVTVPDALRKACAEAVAEMFRAGAAFANLPEGGEAVEAEQIGDYQVTYRTSSEQAIADAESMRAAAIEAARAYRLFSFGFA